MVSSHWDRNPNGRRGQGYKHLGKSFLGRGKSKCKVPVMLDVFGEQQTSQCGAGAEEGRGVEDGR